MQNETEKVHSPVLSEEWNFRNRVRLFLQLAITIASVLLCYLMTLPFLASLSWALALAVLFMPLHRKICRKLRKPTFSAIVTSAIAIIILVIPVLLITIRVVLEIDRGSTLIMNKVESGEWQHNLEKFPYIGKALLWAEDQLDIPSLIDSLTSFLTTQVTSFLKSSLIQIIVIVLTFYLLFFFLRDRNQILRAIRRFSPLCGHETNGLFKIIGTTIRATVFGTIAVAAIQGFLAGFMFWILDLPAPLLWGTIMTILSVIPLLGAYIIWLPASIYLALDGNLIYAVILACWGMFVVGTIDNILYPILISRKLRLHTIVAFISLAGGIFVFGTSGIVLGPITLTASAYLMHIWRTKTICNKRR